MLETKLTPGSDVSWLPDWEGGVKGTGGVISAGCIQMRADGLAFKYVPFVPNGINQCDSEMLDVVSYNFSGCRLVTYKSGAQRMVGHVSTGAGQDCKDAWLQIKATSSGAIEYNPFAAVTNPAPGYGGCYGLITPDGRGFAILVTRGAQAKRTVDQCIQLQPIA